MSDLVMGLLDNKFRCHGCGEVYTPHPDPSTVEEAKFCEECLKVEESKDVTGVTQQ